MLQLYFETRYILMRRIINSILKITPREPEQIFTRRVHLQKRQKQNIQKTVSLPSDPTLINLSLQQLSKKKGVQKFGSFVSRCSMPYHRELNFLADMNIDRALQINKQGIPFTVKDHLKVDKMVSTCGYSYNIAPEYENSEVVDLLINQGCVPFAHTNVPQGLLNIESGNNVWGISVNPYNNNFISGGSSGGQAAAVATKCSAFGIASDSAGSSRIPAVYCGVVGYKPTGSVRLSRKGRLGVSGQEVYLLKDLDVSVGYITRSVDDLSWVCQRTLGKSTSYNPYLLGEWNNEKYSEYKNKKLKFGYIIQDHEMKAVPAVRNSILQSVQLLRKNGHEVVEFKFADLYKLRDFTFKILTLMGAVRGISRVLRGQNQAKQTWWVHERSQLGKLGTIIRQALATSDLQKAVYENYKVGSTIGDLARVCDAKNMVKAQFLKQWKKSGIEALITPVTPFTAPLKYSNEFLLNQLTFCGFPNVLQMPSGAIPIRLVKKEETNYEDQGFYEFKVANSIKMSEGLPVGVQISTAHMEDQLCIAAMWQLEKLLPKLPPPPQTKK